MATDFDFVCTLCSDFNAYFGGPREISVILVDGVKISVILVDGAQILVILVDGAKI